MVIHVYIYMFLYHLCIVKTKRHCKNFVLFNSTGTCRWNVVCGLFSEAGVGLKGGPGPWLCGFNALNKCSVYIYIYGGFLLESPCAPVFVNHHLWTSIYVRFMPAIRILPTEHKDKLLLYLLPVHAGNLYGLDLYHISFYSKANTYPDPSTFEPVKKKFNPMQIFTCNFIYSSQNQFIGLILKIHVLHLMIFV